jgi:poly-gamma-glutamate synthesis protein (capsule biosynthesis protein)
LLSADLVRQLKGDIVTGNLECLIGYAGTMSRVSHSHFQGDPGFSRSLLQQFDVVTLANNHIGDFGDAAIEETLEWLASIGVKSIGIGRSIEEAVEPATFEMHGCKVAVFGATTVGPLLASSRYVLGIPGPHLYKRAKEFEQAGYSCVLHCHSGGGDVRYPSPSTRALLRHASNECFILVLGHHPHIVQGFVAGSRSAVFYSLGDFIFDKLENGRDKALLVQLDINADKTLGVPELKFVQREPDLRLGLLDGDALEQEKLLLGSLSKMICNGESDKAYLSWRGNRVSFFWKSLVRDFKAGGFYAVKAKLGRINRYKIRELLLGR